ncbi:TIGR03086 family metal-binding protein [Nocardioides sp.]|uniref:TIGR03086 family metal-binding protein n=1 Tax=Nocardioides sp. TaxID=35761 RepID=UPI0027241935|nr:TIGR03086 family metal-binding protein [Nocardioides sp.]MDO9454847.1 TIGR03086 family metal-binding protein [Nocardioides sp.]
MTTKTLTDPRPLLLAAVAQVTPYVERITAADLDRPTPCDGWAVRELLAHLVAVEVRIPHILGGGHPTDLPSAVSGVADDAWLEAWTSARDALVTALADDDVLGRMVQHPAGDMPAPQALGIYVSEVCVHAWDLATALGDTSGLDDAPATACLEPMRRSLTREMRSESWVPFGPVVEVADDASPYERLVGWCGRDPRWTA